ncbi:MAG: chromatin binding protein [Cirrosporium novae-zelandiae]|nr:MAG: chromatin binding protein [Cirrosporium novae-zelandiae]
MNLSLADPFVLAQDYPDELTGKLHSGHSACLRFNRKGDFLASGRLDGTIVIFDIETNGVAQKLRGHTRQIQSLSWSHDGRYLLSSSQDWKCILWDLKDGSRIRTVRFQAPVYVAELHPFNHLLFVASLFEDDPVLVDMSLKKPVKRILPTIPRRSDLAGREPNPKQAAQDAKQATCVTIFTAIGNHIISGTNKGWINVIETETCKTIHSEKFGSGMIVFLRLSPSGREMIVNSTDKLIRAIQLPDFSQTDGDNDQLTLNVQNTFQDIVNRYSWNDVAFSPSSDYVTATTYMEHDAFIWENNQGSLVKILEGPKEELGVIEWHPSKPWVAACGLESGDIFIWSVIAPQKWSALAPDFVEVEENVEYVELEDEFDIQPKEEIHKRRMDQEDEDIDVLTMDPVKGDVEQNTFRMPILLDIDNSESEDEVIAVGPGTMRRKSPGAGKEWMDGDDDDEQERVAQKKPTNGTNRSRTKSRKR